MVNLLYYLHLITGKSIRAITFHCRANQLPNLQPSENTRANFHDEEVTQTKPHHHPESMVLAA